MSRQPGPPAIGNTRRLALGSNSAFVNAVAWMVHAEDHHPDLHVGYNRCTVRWNTHSVAGISENDFICAAKTDATFARTAA